MKKFVTFIAVLLAGATAFAQVHIGAGYLQQNNDYANGKDSDTALNGFAASEAAVMVVHSADDDVIEITYGYDKFFDKYGDDDRFTFVRFEDRGHNEIFNDPENTYKDEFNAGFDKWLETLGYDYKAEENKDRFTKDKAAYITENLDHARWSNRLDEALFARFLAFYDEAI